MTFIYSILHIITYPMHCVYQNLSSPTEGINKNHQIRTLYMQFDSQSQIRNLNWFSENRFGLRFEIYCLQRGKIRKVSICFDSLPEKTHHIHVFSGLKVPTKYVKASEFYLLITQRHWIFPSLIPNVRNPSYLHA